MKRKTAHPIRINSGFLHVNNFVIVILIILFFFLSTPVSVLAASKVFTSQSDFKTGYFSGTEADNKQGSVNMVPAGSWGPHAFKAPDLTLSDQAAITSDGNNIYLLHNNDERFDRYLPSENRWQNLTSAPHSAFPGAGMVVLGNYIYAIFGGYSNVFTRYDIINNSWTTLATLPDLDYAGASVGTDGTYIYALRGAGTSDFWKYDPSSNTWTVAPSTPASISSGAHLIYYSGAFYTARGNGTQTFYKYTISSGTWSTLASTIPATISTDMSADVVNGVIYMTRGGGTQTFYKYTIASDTWTTVSNTPVAVQYVGLVYNSSDNYIYVFRGNGQYDFWKYDYTNDRFLGVADLPNTPGTGSDLAYLNGYIYFPRGANTGTMYRYQISSNTWSAALSTAPVNFNDDVKVATAGSSLYFLTGSGASTFTRYDPGGDTWTPLATTPTGVNGGASLVYPGTGDYIYATRGNNTLLFWRYSISGNTWDDPGAADLPAGTAANTGGRLTTDGIYIYYYPGNGSSKFLKYNIGTNTWSTIGTVPFSPYYGTDMQYYGGKIYALGGYYKTDFWEYTIATNTWRRLPDLSSLYAYSIGPYNGASLEIDSSGNIYASYGQSLVWVSQYTPATTNYPNTTATWTSDVIDLTYVNSFSSFTSDSSVPGNSSLSFQTSTSPDKINWSAWQTVSGTTIASAVNRYIKVKANYNASSDLSQAPRLDDFTITYAGDTNPPSNPTSITATSQQVGGVSLISNGIYGYTNPYFAWSGASDSETSVAGYYVYFGPNSNADPTVSGNFQSASTYMVNSGMTNGTYYLILATKDASGNVSAAKSMFTYIYKGVIGQILSISGSSSFATATTSAVSTINDTIKLATTSGFWQQTRLSLPPAGIYYGGHFAYVASSNKLYTFRGNNTNTFYEYNITTDTWTAKANAPGNVYYGGHVIEGPPGYLYGFPANNSAVFWRYDIANDVWSDAAATDAPQPVYYGAASIYDGSRYIYTLKGNNDDTLMRYDTQNDVWTTLANTIFGAPTNQGTNMVYTGGNLTYDGKNTIYAIQGSVNGNDNTGFSAYDIPSNTWSVLSNLPITAYDDGATISYDAVSNAIYYIPAAGKPYLYKYDFGSSTWTRLADAPLPLTSGATMRAVNGLLYVLRGGNNTNFYVYNPASNSWQIPNIGLFAGIFWGTDYRTFNYGADIIKGDGNNYYITRGNYDNMFVRYNPVTGDDTRLADAPCGFYTGGKLVYDSTANQIYATCNTYTQKFFMYDIAADAWSEVTTDPPPVMPNTGVAMVYDSSRYIYYVPAGGSTAFYEYDKQAAAGSRWIIRAVTPGSMSYGAELIYKGGYLYGLRGNNTVSFYRYTPGSNTWSDPVVADLPSGANVYNDGFMVDSGGDLLYACRGGNVANCYAYSIAGNTWTAITNAPANISQGGAAASDGVNKIYVIAGPGTNTFSDGVYTYVMSTPTSAFQTSGTYISQTYDLTSVYKFGGLSYTATPSANTVITAYTRTSSDNSTWSSWAQVTQEKVTGVTYSDKITSPTARYLQVKFAFTSSDGVYSGTVGSYTFTYYSDTAPPTNPSNFSAYTTATQSATLTSNNWYNYSSPYFSWPAAEATGGASDGTTGSGVTGYYVYFGTNSNANPAASGTLQSTTSYTASSLTSGNTYYLLIKTVDDAGNVSSSSVAPFVYRYDSDSPTNPTTLTVTPSSYSNVNLFNFNWSGASDSASGIQDYCYKTGQSGAVDTCGITSTSIASVSAYTTGVNTLYLRTRDNAGNYATNYQSISYYYSSTSPGGPQNLTVTPTSNTVNSFAFSWSPPASYYGVQSSLRYYYSVNALPTAQNVNTIGLSTTYLVADAYATLPGKNIMYVVAKDEAGNIDYNNYSSVSFTADTSAPGIPGSLDIADISVKSVSSWKLALSWEPPTATGSGVSTYKVYGSTSDSASCTDNLSDFSYLASTTGKSFVDSNIIQETHYYCVKACDSTNNCSAPSETVSMYPTGKWLVSPDMTASPSATIKTKTAIISWSTSRGANSFVKYGTKSGDYGDEVGSSEQITNHQITLTGLTPGTEYYYRVLWTDEDGNLGTSDEYTFTTNAAPFISNVKITNISLYSAYVSFDVKNASSVNINYGLTTSYGNTKTESTPTSETIDTILLDNLTDGTTYHLQIVGLDQEGNQFSGDDYSFTTLPVPKVTAMKIQEIAGLPSAALRILWTTNAPVTSIITYYPSDAPATAKDQITLQMVKTHEMVLQNLRDSTDYTIQIRGKDAAGNEADAQPTHIHTAADLRPPELLNLDVESTIVGVGQDAKAQLVITWDTDEPGTTQIQYAEGTGNTYGQTTQQDTNLTENHTVTITGLTPAKIYHFQALSKDKAGNLGKSLDTVVTTPKATTAALNLVIDNLAKTFGFLQKLNQ